MIGPLFAIERRLAKTLQKRVEERLGKMAVAVALDRFARLHPHWYDTLFDAQFLERIPLSSLRGMDGSTLALEWSSQFWYRGERERSIELKQVRPIAESFLTLQKQAEAELRERMGLVAGAEADNPRHDACAATAGAAGSPSGRGSPQLTVTPRSRSSR